MPKAKRLQLPGVAQHVIQRGNDSQACFFEATDYLCYLQALREAALRYACQMQALVAEAIPDGDLAAIRLYVQRQRALDTQVPGADRAAVARRAGIGRPGRPRKEKVL